MVGMVGMIMVLGCKPDPVAPTTDPESAADPGGPTAVAEPVETQPPEPGSAVVAANDDAAEDNDAVAATDDQDDGQDADSDSADPAADPAAKPDPKQPQPVATQERDPLPKPAHKLTGPACQQSFAVGSKVKGFRLPSVDGEKTISPNGYRKRVLLLNFWGTWCKPCLKELPEFDRLYRKYRKHGLTLVAVATDEEPKAVQAFIDKHKLRAKVALAGEEAAGAYNRPNFPFSFVIDGSGKIVAAYEFIDDSCMGDLEQVIRDELEKLD
ncbi:Thiol-disulfide oxidoreductase ResA [Enhygromyxa salina]|uniref:Thiol-disulfide oxidoreductase ResA n=2 Tax=Enhygromyxa salina TaxID=215803 RepID=A0A2S9Y8B2_9BACT|nr:Thiol-disulfide oxidoreductase ResA [Enhygromyxa salina]